MPAEALAVKVFSMSVLANLAKYYPEIKAELKLIIEDQESKYVSTVQKKLLCT